MPKSMIPKDVYEVFNSDTGTMMAIFFDEGTSSDGTMEAIGEIRKLAGKQCFLSGMSAIVTDTKNLAEKETPLYVLIAVVLAVIVLGLTMDSYFIPLLFMLSIGMAIGKQLLLWRDLVYYEGIGSSTSARSDTGLFDLSDAQL